MKPKDVFTSAASQLTSIKRKREESFQPTCSSDNVNDFLQKLKDPPLGPGTCPVLVLDNVDKVIRSASWLSSIVRCREQQGGASLSVILISSVAWGSGALMHLPPITTLHFPAYQREELVEVLMKDCPASAPTQLYRSFLASVVYDQFNLVTRTVSGLRAIARQLWPKYIQPVEDRRVAAEPFERAVGQLYRHVSEHVQALLKGEPTYGLASATTTGRLGVSAASPAQGEDKVLQLPRVGKLLLVAAFICSHNKATLDKALFDFGARQGRIRSRGHMNSDRQVEAAKEARLAGPHNFPLQRLLLIYCQLQRTMDDRLLGDCTIGRSMAAAAGDCLPGMDDWDRAAASLGESAQMMDLISHMCAMRLIVETSDDPLLDPKYVCTVPQDLVGGLADQLGIRLANFLRYA